MKRTVTATTTAWLTNSYYGPNELKVNDDLRIVNMLGYSASSMESVGWTKCGTAIITIELHDEKELIEAKVESLDAEIAKAYAEAESTINRLKEMKSKLLAIGFDDPADIQDIESVEVQF